MPGRNDPCSCGSGKKYKKCCLNAETTAVNPVHALDDRLMMEIVPWAGRNGFDPRIQHVEEAEFGLNLVMTVFQRPLYHGRALAAAFREARQTYLSAEELAWIDTQLQGYLSIWRVTGVRPGVGLEMRDVLTGTERFVDEVSGSRSLEVGLYVLARVLDWKGRSVLAGLHENPLTPLFGAELEAALRELLGVPSGPVPLERLRETEIYEAMPRQWSVRVARMTKAGPLTVDGHPIELHIDTFEVHEGQMEESLQRLHSLWSGRPRLEGTSPIAFVIADGDVQLGRVFVEDNRLRLALSSRAHRDRFKPEMEGALEGVAEHVDHEIPDLSALSDSVEPRELTPEELQATRAAQRAADIRWLDTEVPVLDGLTPREAAKRPEFHKRIDALMDDLAWRCKRSRPEMMDLVDELHQTLSVMMRAASQVENAP